MQALAAEERAFDVPKGPLSTVLPVISRQAGVSISVVDAKLWQARVKPVRGRMSVEKAIERLLARSDARRCPKKDRAKRTPPCPAARRPCGAVGAAGAAAEGARTIA